MPTTWDENGNPIQSPTTATKSWDEQGNPVGGGGQDFSKRPSWWDTTKKFAQGFWEATPPGQIQSEFQTASDKLAPKVEQRRQENLVAAAQGKPAPNSEAVTSAMGMGEAASRFGAGATSPTGVAVAGATALLPEVMGPALIAHGGYNLGASLPEAVQGNPEAVEKALSSGSEMVGGGAALGGAVRAGGGPVRQMIKEAAMENPDTAALKAVGVDANSPKAAKALADIQKARPYAGAPKTQAELQTNVGSGSAARNEIWNNYTRALQQVGNRVVQGPDGPATVNSLEAERLELSARNRLAKSGNPSALQELAQKGLSVSDSLAREQAVISAIDPELSSTGIDPKLTRATMGGVKGVSRRVEGRMGGLETAPSGIGRLVDKGRINVGSSGPSIYMPENIRTAIAGGMRDIAADRGWFKQVPADVAAREGFRNPGAKPNLAPGAVAAGMPYGTPAGPAVPPAAPNSTPPPVPPQYAREAIGAPGAEAPQGTFTRKGVTPQTNITLPEEARGKGFILEHPNVLAGNQGTATNELPSNGGIAGLLPGPPAPFEPPPPGPDLPQAGEPPAGTARFPEESPMWSPSVGRGDPVNWNAPRPEFPEELGGGAKPPQASPPTDLTGGPKVSPSATVLPEQVKTDFVDRSVHPWESDARVQKKIDDLQQGGDATIVARPNPDGTVSPVKGHNTPVAAARTGQPVNIVDSGPITDGEKAAMTAESHFFPQDDRAVPASLAKDAASERESLPDEIKDAPALPAKEGPASDIVQTGNSLPEQLGALKGGIKAQGVEATLAPRDPALELQNYSSEISRLKGIIQNPAATAEEKAVASSQLLNNQRLRTQLQKGSPGDQIKMRGGMRRRSMLSGKPLTDEK